jgi:hypothetical protein
MDIRAIKVVRVAAGEDAAAWRDALSKPGWADAATVLKEDRGSWVRRANLLGRDVVVKCRELNTIGRRFKHAIGMGHGAKHWRGAERLCRANIRTGAMCVSARANVDGRLCELLVVEFIPGQTVLQLLDDIARGMGPSVRTQHTIATAVGETIPALLRAGWYNRDHKPSNLVVMPSPDNRVDIAIIDCVGIRKYGWMGIDECEAEEMLASLVIEPLGCGCSARRALWARTLMGAGWEHTESGRPRLREVREAIECVKAFVEGHGDPRPRVNPLAENRQGLR